MAVRAAPEKQLLKRRRELAFVLGQIAWPLSLESIDAAVRRVYAKYPFKHNPGMGDKPIPEEALDLMARHFTAKYAQRRG